MPFPPPPRTPTWRDYVKRPETPCGLRDFANARSKFINFAQVKVNQNYYNRNQQV